jgi:hypothetical protein
MTLVQTEAATGSEELIPVVRKAIRATRSDGSTVEAVVDGQGNFLSRTVTLPAQRKVVQINEDVRATTTYYLSENRAGSLRVYSGNADCTHISPFWKKVGEEDVLGFRTHRFSVSSESVSESTVFEHCVAPDLDCASLRDSAQWTDGKRKNGSLKQVESVKLGEPDSKLFEIPGSYREMSPSQVEQTRALTVLRRELPPLVTEGLKQRDKRYHESWKNKP